MVDIGGIMKNLLVFDTVTGQVQGTYFVEDAYPERPDLLEVTTLPPGDFIPFLQIEDNTVGVHTVQEALSVLPVHNIPDVDPANGIPEIPGDGTSHAEITVKIKTGDTYGLNKIGEGEWDYEKVKTADGAVIIDNTYEGKKVSIGTTKGMLNKTEITLDAESKGTFKLKSEAKTCVGDEAAVITITPVDIADCLPTTLRVEFAPVDF
jgi:hypothetical protein